MVVTDSAMVPRVRRAALAWLTALVIGAGGVAHGAAGDALVVAKDQVNLRQGPGAEHAILTTLAVGQAVTEIARHGDWVNVRLDDATNKSGWVHRSLVAMPEARPAATPATTPPQANFALLASAVEQLNTFALNQGYAYFSAARDLGSGGAEVVATEHWLAAPEGFRTSNFNALAAVWQVAAGANGPTTLRIVDAEGGIVMETSAPVEAPAEAPAGIEDAAN
jgi:SH3-like domain-containing protein